LIIPDSIMRDPIMQDSIRPGSMKIDETRRRELLQAMGVDVYLLRSSQVGAVVVGEGIEAASVSPEPNDLDLVVASAADAARDPAAQRLRALLPLALGLPAERIRWITAAAGGVLPDPPAARAYLALGADMPRALGANLSTMQQMSVTLAAADEPASSLRDGLSRRALWQALKPLARLHRHPN
jgi:hypothetical protein